MRAVAPGFAAQERLWKLSLDLWSARLIAWAAIFGRDARLTPAVHAYLADRYAALADAHRRKGHGRIAARLKRRADEHFLQSGGDEPPRAAAMAMPRPRPFAIANAVSRRRLNGPDDAA